MTVEHEYRNVGSNKYALTPVLSISRYKRLYLAAIFKRIFYKLF